MQSVTSLILTIFLLFHIQLLIAQDAVVANYNTTITYEEDGIIKEHYIKLKINNRDGDALADFRIPYSKLIEVDGIEGYITDEFGATIRKLKKKEITESSQFSEYTFYSDEMVKRFSLRHYIYPYYVVVKYAEKVHDYLNICNWSPVYHEKVSTLDAKLILKETPLLKYKHFSRYLKQTSYTKDDETLVQWKGAYKGIDNNEIFAPHLRQQIPYLVIVPDAFTFFNKGYSTSWQTFGDWYLNICDGLDQLTDAEKAEVDKITSAITDTTELIKALYNYLQDNTHYINITIEHGGFVPYPASYVCDNNYGDCKALTNYMKALLKYKGIESNFALVFGGDTYPKINPKIITSQFNHVILSVPLQQDTIWLECTSSLLPLNSLGTFTQNRKCLFIEKDNSRLISTPKLTTEACCNSYKYDFTSDSTEQTNVSGEAEIGASKAMYIRNILNNHSKNLKLEKLSAYVDITNIHLDSYSAENNDRNEVQQKFAFTGDCPSPFVKLSDYTRIYHPKYNMPYFEKPEERKRALVLNYPLVYSDTICYDNTFPINKLISESYNIIESEFGIAHINRSFNDTSLIITRDYKIFAQKIPKSKYKGFYQYIDEIYQNLISTIIK